MNFKNGNIYNIANIQISEFEIMKQNIKNKFKREEFLNFPLSFSLKVNVVYNKLKKREIINLKNEISKIITKNFFLEDADYSEKVMIVLFSLLKENDIIIVNTDGMSPEGIEYLNKEFKEIVGYLNKILVIHNSYED